MASQASKPTVTVLDYGAGNVRSVINALELLGCDVDLVRTAKDVRAAEILVFPGVGCFAAGLFAGWVILVLLFCLPLMIYAASRSLFSESAASKDCASFPRSSHEFENNLCVSRFWTLLVGGGIFLVTVIAITILGGMEYLQALFKLRNKAAVMRPKPAELDPIMRSTGPGNSVNATFSEPLQAFVNPKFKAKPKTSNEFLYGANKLYVPPSHR